MSQAAVSGVASKLFALGGLKDVGAKGKPARLLSADLLFSVLVNAVGPVNDPLPGRSRTFEGDVFLTGELRKLSLPDAPRGITLALVVVVDADVVAVDIGLA